MRLTGFRPQHDCESCRLSNTRPSARAETRITKESSALQLRLKTAEGDIVEISLDARSLRQSERAAARGPGDWISQRRETRSSSLTASVNVAGDISDAELEDIRGLLQSLAGGDAPGDGDVNLDTISAYQYSYQRQREVSRATVELYG